MKRCEVCGDVLGHGAREHQPDQGEPAMLCGTCHATATAPLAATGAVFAALVDDENEEDETP